MRENIAEKLTSMVKNSTSYKYTRDNVNFYKCVPACLPDNLKVHW